MKLGYMNSRRPSKPNLPSVPKPSKLFAPTRLRRTFVISSLPNSAIARSINQASLASFGNSPKLPKLQNTLHTEKMWVVLGYKSPLKVWQWEREGEEATKISH